MWPRAFAGVVAGFFLAAAATGLLAWGPPGPWQRALVPTLIAFIPLWMLAALWAFSFRSALRAWVGILAPALLMAAIARLMGAWA